MKALEIRDLTKTYGKTAALSSVNLSLEEGFTLGLLGRNGAGKTTLIKAILGLINCEKGSVDVYGKNIKQHLRQVKDMIGFVHESSYLYRELSLAEHEKILASAYSRWDSERFSVFLEKLSLPKKTKIKTFSKGMKMRASLAIALSHNASLILMDEPSSGLDPLVRREMVNIIREELTLEKRSFLISTHITSDLESIADYLVILDKGEILLSASKPELTEKYAICKGGNELLDSGIAEYLTDIRKSSYGFTAFTSDRDLLSRKYHNSLVIEPANIEDLMVHTLSGGKHENIAY